MVKKNVSLLALMAFLTAGSVLTGQDGGSDGSVLTGQDGGSDGSDLTGQYGGLEVRPLPINSSGGVDLNPTPNADNQQTKDFQGGGSEREGADTEFLDILSRKSGPKTTAQKAKDYINNAFKSMDDWMKTETMGSLYTAGRQKKLNLLNDTKEFDSMTARGETAEYYYTETSKKATAKRLMNESLDSLGRGLGTVPGMQSVKDAMNKAIDALVTESKFDNPTLRIMVNGLKALLVAPVKIAVRAGGIGVGASLGGASGVVAGLGAGAYRTAKNISKSYKKANSGNERISLIGVANAIPRTFVSLLYGVVSTPVLVAYGAVEGVVFGGLAGSEFGTETLGNDIFRLKTESEARGIRSKQEERAKAEKAREEKAKAEARAK